MGENLVASGGTMKSPSPNVLTPNLVHIIVNLYSFPFVIKEYVGKQLASITMKDRGKHEGTFKDSGKVSKTSVKEGNKGSTVWRGFVL